jgi:hypothetical protein
MGETKLGTRMSGSNQRLPGRSVRSITNASIAPSGTAMSVIPVEITSELPSALQKSESAKTNS